MLYRVSAKHVCPEYVLEDQIIKVEPFNYPTHTVYSCTLRKFGSGKETRTPEDAIYSLLGSNGCTSIKINKVAGQA